MSDDAMDKGGQQIVETILAEADARAKEIVENAERAAKAQVEKAQRQADVIRADILADAQHRSEKVRERETASGQIEAKRMLLRAREELTARVLDQLEGCLRTIRQDPDESNRSLWNLAGEAVCAVGQSEVVLKVGKADAGLVDEALAERLAAEASDEAGRSIAVTLQLDERDLGGGCIAQSPDGRIVYDNTYPKRMERGRKDLRARIVKELVQDND